ncbi:hypothetical protein [Martelella sp. AD-3]|uniref:phage major capsid protein n=1 Tax=Martelella sp. AD-3 TaxID=686597 RepID=UPI000464FDDD|nr:hypothetical protein [Martelella sp. AD-3]AMM83989.1 hypothetical protein AZF01_06115 [Martelella sp. AD-3]
MTLLMRRTQARPNSYDPETRSFTVIAATEAPVDRGDHIEVLDLDAFFAAGLPESLPLQTDHSQSVRDTVGRMNNFRIETIDGRRALVADAVLSGRADNDALAANLKDGAQTGFSVGYTVSRWQKSKDGQTGKPMRRAVAGRFVEGSLVINPADANAFVRMDTMETETQTGNENAGLDDATLRTIARSAGIADATIDTVLSRGGDNEARMRGLLESLGTAPLVRSAGNHNEDTLDNPQVLCRAAIDAFDAINRGQAPTGAASAVFAEGEAAFARRILRNAGQNIAGLSDAMVLRNAAATADYAIIAGGTFNLSMRREYEAALSPIATLFGETTVETFNKETSGLVDWTTLAIGDKLENGHYKASYVDESGETIFVSTIGGVTSVSRELSINAGSRLGDMGSKYGRRLAADLADRQVAFLEQNDGAGPKMADGKAVFHASRGNIGIFEDPADTGDALQDINLLLEKSRQVLAFRSSMSRRKGKGDVIIGVYPTHWLVPPEYEADAVRMVLATAPTNMAEINPLAGKLVVVSEPRLSNAKRSWLVAEPAKMDGATRVLLRGNEAPFTDSRQNFDTDAIDFKIRQDFGLGWLEWRSWTRLDHTEAAG